jgi:SAM-dependent methyltransferase
MDAHRKRKLVDERRQRVTSSEDVRRSYDAIAEEYARRMFHELVGKPLDRQLLDRFADAVRGSGRVADVGCGPGHVARYLRERGVDVVGLDLSPQMVRIAKRLNPSIEFVVADMLALAVCEASWAGAVSFYSLIHLTGSQLQEALRQLRWALRPRAPLLIGVHRGDETRHIEEWWGHRVALDGVFFETYAFVAEVEAAGFRVEEAIERPPYKGLEVETERMYVYAHAHAARPPNRDSARDLATKRPGPNHRAFRQVEDPGICSRIAFSGRLGIDARMTFVAVDAAAHVAVSKKAASEVQR